MKNNDIDNNCDFRWMRKYSKSEDYTEVCGLHKKKKNQLTKMFSAERK